MVCYVIVFLLHNDVYFPCVDILVSLLLLSFNESSEYNSNTNMTMTMKRFVLNIKTVYSFHNI